MKYPIVEVEWLDILDQCLDWEKVDKQVVISQLAKCRTAGYMIHKGKDRVVITNSFSGDEASSTVAIPTGCITRIRKLGKAG